MKHNLKLEIGSVKINIESDNINLERLDKERYKDFIINGSRADILLRLRQWQDLPDFKRDSLIFEAPQNWKLYQEPEDRYLFDIFNPTLTTWLEKVIIVNRTFTQADMYLAYPPAELKEPVIEDDELLVLLDNASSYPPSQPPKASLATNGKTTGSFDIAQDGSKMVSEVEPLPVGLHKQESPVESKVKENGPLDYMTLDRIARPFIEILLLNYLINNQGIMVHALGVSIGDKGILFTGESGAGKSTLAKIFSKYCPEASILNDERIIIKRHNKDFFLYGSPWAGDAGIASNKSAPLKNIFFIYHKKINIIDSLSFNYALKNMLSQSYLSFWNKDYLQTTLSFYDSLLSSKIKYNKLGFVNDEKIIEFLKEENIL